VPGELSGLVAVVTGGASGIGEATAVAMHERGAAVVVLDLQQPYQNNRFFGITCDISNDDSVERAFAAISKRFGAVDIVVAGQARLDAGIHDRVRDLVSLGDVVNNAGVGAQGDITANELSQWRQVFEVNVLGIVRTTRAALPLLRRSTHAAIVNTCSIAATAGLPQRALYSASKGAVQSLTLAMAADHLAEGIRVNCVNPGTADTPWVARLLASAADPAAERHALEARQPHGRLVSAAEIAAAICYLAGPSAASVTGTALAVDGGMQGLRLRPRT